VTLEKASSAKVLDRVLDDMDYGVEFRMRDAGTDGCLSRGAQKLLSKVLDDSTRRSNRGVRPARSATA